MTNLESRFNEWSNSPGDFLYSPSNFGLLLLKRWQLLLLLLLERGRLSQVGVRPPFRQRPPVGEDDEEQGWDEEEADEGLEHRDEALDVVVVAVVILFLLLLLIFNLIWNIDRPLKVTTSEVFALKKLALP